MSLLSAHIPLLFGAACSIVSVISMAAITVTGYQYLRSMESTQTRIRTEKIQARHTPPRF